jgi:hypothetical protein
LSCRRRQIWACPRSPEVFGLWYIAVMAMEIDLFEIDLAAGKFWLDLAREEKLRKRRDEIRLKHHRRRLGRGRRSANSLVTEGFAGEAYKSPIARA